MRWSTRWWIRIGWQVSRASSVEKARPVKMTRKSDAWSGSRNLSRTIERFGVVASLRGVSYARLLDRILCNSPDHTNTLQACSPSTYKLEKVRRTHPRRNRQYSNQTPIFPFCFVTRPFSSFL